MNINSITCQHRPDNYVNGGLQKTPKISRTETSTKDAVSNIHFFGGRRGSLAHLQWVQSAYFTFCRLGKQFCQY